jgi:hypothetical protein
MMVLATAVLGAVASLAGASPAVAGEGNPGTSHRDRIGTVGITYSYATQWLNPGQAWTFGSGGMGLRLRSTGRLVVTNSANVAVWSTSEAGPGAQLRFQLDGNLVLYRSNGTPHWASGTFRNCFNPNSNKVLSLQDDNNVVIYCLNPPQPPRPKFEAMWATGT